MTDGLPDDLISLWAISGGRSCTLTRPTCGPPFVVTLWRGSLALQARTFDNHDSAMEWAIHEMRAALSRAAADSARVPLEEPHAQSPEA